MGKAPADQFYWNDWLGDVELQAASACTKGVWINALARMWNSKIRGELQGTKNLFQKYVSVLLMNLIYFGKRLKR